MLRESATDYHSDSDTGDGVRESDSPFPDDLYLTPEFEAFATRLRRERRFWQGVESFFRRMLGMSPRNRHGMREEDEQEGEKDDDFL